MNINFYKGAFPRAWVVYEEWLSMRDYEVLNHDYWLPHFCGDTDVEYWLDKLERRLDEK